ncbi:MAG: PhnD/SsuA/transferrin family substrate-binding protein [Clostridia bacterium]|nr:PhnD/SsuA/transferrin family substrate-binding protein [Clostridia bacterium]
MKKIFALLLTLALLVPLTACKYEIPKGENEPPLDGPIESYEAPSGGNGTVRIMAMTGPTGMGLAELMHNDKAGSGNGLDYSVELVSSPDQVIPAFVQGNVDIAAVPINLASVLYAKTNGGVKIICANTLGVLYMLENGDSVKSVADLRGKTIYAPNPGSTPEYILRYVLKENGIDPDKDVTLEFLTGGDEVAAKLASTPGAVGMLPEPKKSAFLSTNTQFRVALDMTEEWNKVAGEGNKLVQGVFVAAATFADEMDWAVRTFMEDYNRSQSFVNTNELGAEYVVEAGIIPKAPLAKKAIPGCNITFLDGQAMKDAVTKCLQVLFDANPASIGSAMPSDDIFYIEEAPAMPDED